MSGDNQELGRGCKCFQNKVSENHFFRWIRGDNEKLGKRSKCFQRLFCEHGTQHWFNL